MTPDSVLPEKAMKRILAAVTSLSVLSVVGYLTASATPPGETQSRPAVAIRPTMTPRYTFKPRDYRVLARQTLLDAEHYAALEPKPLYRTWATTMVAGAWRTLDAARSRKLLRRAWALSQTISNANDRGIQQSDIVLQGWAGIDLAEARRLTPKIREQYWREFARDFLPQHAAASFPDRAVKLLNALSPERRSHQTMEAAFNLMHDDPDAAIRLLLQTKSSDQDGYLANLAYNLAYSGDLLHAKKAIALIRDASSREGARALAIERIADWAPREAEGLLAQVHTRLLRCRSLAHLAVGYRVIDPTHARQLATECLQIARGLPARERDTHLITTLYERLFQVDRSTPTDLLAAATEQAARENEWIRGKYLLTLAGVWAKTDLSRARQVFAAALQADARAPSGPHGQHVESGFASFVEGLALQEPREAADLLRKYAAGMSGGISGGEEHGWSYENYQALEIAGRVAPINAERASDFVTEFGGKQLQEQFRIRQLEAAVQREPQSTEKVQALLSEPAVLDTTIGHTAVQLAASDVQSAEKMVALLHRKIEKSETLTKIARERLKNCDPDSIQFLRKARLAALAEADGFNSAQALVQCANAALLAPVLWRWSAPDLSPALTVSPVKRAGGGSTATTPRQRSTRKAPIRKR